MIVPNIDHRESHKLERAIDKIEDMMIQERNPKTVRSLENIIRLAESLHYNKKIVREIKKVYEDGVDRFGITYLKRLEKAASEIITQDPSLLSDYFDYLCVSADKYTGYGLSRDWDEKFDAAFNQQQYIKVVKELVLKAPELADIIATPLLTERTFYPDYSIMDDDGESAVKNAVTRVKNKNYTCIKNIGFSRKKLRMLEKGALRLEKARLMDGIPEEYWETASSVINHHPEMFQEFINLGIKLEKDRYLTAIWKKENYFKNVPEILLTRPDDFHKFRRAAELIVKNSCESGYFLKYGPEIFSKYPHLFIKYCQYGLKASNTGSNPKFGTKDKSMHGTGYFEIAHRLITLDEELFHQYIDNITIFSNNFTENHNIKDYMWQVQYGFKSKKREEKHKEKVFQKLKVDHNLGGEVWRAKIKRAYMLQDYKRLKERRMFEASRRPQLFSYKESEHDDDLPYTYNSMIKQDASSQLDIIGNHSETANHSNRQWKPKPLEEVISRSMTALRKRGIDISEEIFMEIQSLSKSHPNALRAYFSQALELACRYEQTELSEDYLKSAIDIIKYRPESLNEFYENGRQIIKKIRFNRSADRFSSMAKVIIDTPEKFKEYIDLGSECIHYDSEHGSVADAFFRKFAKIAISRPSDLKKVSEYLKDIHSMNADSNTLTKALDIADVLIYPGASKRMQAYKSIVKIKKKIGINSTELEEAYLIGAKKILENDQKNISLFESEGLKLLRTKSNIAAITQAFFHYSPNVFSLAPQLLKEYINTGAEYINRILYWEKSGKNTKEYFSISDALITNPLSFKKKINNYTRIDEGEFISMKVDREMREDIRNERYFDVRTVIPDKSIWLQNPWSYRILSKFATKFYSKDWYLGELFTSTQTPMLIQDKALFQEHVETGWKISEISVYAGHRYFKQFSNSQINPQILEKSIRNIHNAMEIMSANQEHTLKQKECQIDFWDINPYRWNNRGYGHQWGIIVKDTYDITSAIIKSLGDMKLTRMEEKALKKLPEKFLEDIRRDHKQIRIQDRYPIINELLTGEKTLPDRENMQLAYSRQQYGINPDNDARLIMRSYMDELVHYFKKTLKVSEDSKRVLDQLYDRAFSDFDSNTIITEIYDNKVEDYFSDRLDCISYQGKYSEESKNFIINPYSAIININGYDCSGNRKFLKTLGKIVTCIVDIEGKKALYVAGLSAEKELDYIHGWEHRTYKNIIKIAKQNIKNIDGILWDLNPRNRNYLSHRWAEHVASQIGLESGKDYDYQKKNFSTPDFPTKNSETTFELLHPEWKEIKILRDEGLEGKFFLESVMNEPKNRQIEKGSKPFLVYDQGYILGKYVSIK